MYYYESGRKRKGVYFWIVVLILFVVFLNTPFVRRSKPLHVFKAVASNILFPFKYVFYGTYVNSTSGVREFFRLKDIQKENEALKVEINGYKAQMVLLNGLSSENEKLRSAMSFRARSFIPRLLTAEIIGRSGSNWFNVVELNRGTADRVAPDCAVINAEGLVGRVFEVSQFSSKVLLITDPSSAVSVVNAGTGDMGIASGNAMGPLRILYVSATAPIKVGDKITTSGMSDIFPKGVTVGVVSAVSKKDYDIFQKVSVSTAVNFSRLDKVFVITK
jgi:rod shape-determining protein MreC